MKARFLALAALVLGLASCQTEPEGLNVNVGGEQDVTVCVSLPEVTRANSAEGAFVNVDWDQYTIRYIMQIYDKDNNPSAVVYETCQDGDDGNSVAFDVRLVPNRKYTFAVWADIVKDSATGEYEDWHYNTVNDKGKTDITNITIKDWTAMDETRDAFAGRWVEESYSGNSTINVKLTRPFAKLRVQTTDMAELEHLGITPVKVVVNYETTYRPGFNALEGKALAFGDEKKTHTISDIRNLYENGTLFVDYFFAESDIVKFYMTVKDQNDVDINKTLNFTTDIAAKRNHLTTIKGNLLTEANEVEVEVVENGAFANENIYIEGDYTLTQDMVIDCPLVVRKGAKAVINLNGHTITADLKQEGRHHYAIDNYGTLTLEGEGAINARGIENFGTMTINGNITITNVDTNGGSAIWNEGNLVINGGTFTTNAMAGEGSYGGALYTTEEGSAVINGGNFIANSQLTYAIINEGETTINNADVKGKHGAVAGAETNDKTTINGGSFELMENPNVSDHCVYYVSEIKGGKFTLGTNTDSGAQVFYGSTIAEGLGTAVRDGYYVVVPQVVADLDNVTEETEVKFTKDLNVTSNTTIHTQKATAAITIDGNYKSVVSTAESADDFQWENGRFPAMSTIFSSANGAKVTVNNLSFEGTMSALMLGHYVDSNSNWYNTELNNVNVVNTEVVSFSQNIAPAVCVYGKATLNNCKIYGTTLSELDTDPMWPVYDVAVVNEAVLTINNSEVGTIIAWEKSKVVVETGSVVESIKPIFTSMNSNEKYGFVIKAGATVKVLDLSNIDANKKINIAIEKGATVGKVIANGTEYPSLEAYIGSVIIK